MKRLIIAYLIFFSTSLAYLLVAKSFWQPGGGDFSAFYAAGSIVRSGDGAHLYDYATQAAAQEQFTRVLPYRKIPLLYPHPPFETAIFAPLALFNYKTAFVIWWAASHLCLFLSFFFLQKSLTHESVLPVVVACMSLFFPLQHVLILGQDTTLLLLAMTVCLWALLRERDSLAGAALAFVMIKPQLALPIFLLLAIRSSKKFTMAFFSVCAGLVIISVAMIGTAGVASYYPFLRHFSTMPPEISGSFPSQMANLHGLLFHFGIDSRGLTYAASTAVLLVAVLLSRKTPKKALVAFAVPVALIVSYHTMEHDLALLVLPFAIAMDELHGQRITAAPRIALALTAFAMMWVLALSLGPMFRLAAIACFASVAWIDIEETPEPVPASTMAS